MYWNVKTVKPLSDYRIYVEIKDGRKGVFDMTPYFDAELAVRVLQESVDVVVLRDVVERHNIGNMVPLRRLVHHHSSKSRRKFCGQPLSQRSEVPGDRRRKGFLA